MAAKSKNKWIAKAVVIIGVIIIPLLYSFFYLEAFWDPYARLDDVPVAVVNLDKGANINGKNRNIGQEICDNLKEDGSLDFRFVSDKNAKDGVLNQDYYASITIPADFSSNVSTITEDTEKLHSQIVYSANQKKNYLAAQILENAMPTIKETVNSSIDKEIITTLSDKLNSVPDQMGELQDGLQQLSDGSKTLANGTSDLDKGATTLKDGSKTLSGGATQVADGSKTLNNGISTLKTGTAQLKSAVPTLASGVGALDTGAKKLSLGADSLSAGLTTYTNGVATAANGAGTLSTGLTTYTNGVATAANGASTLSSGLTTYTDGVATAADGAGTLKSGVATYTAGVSSAKDGSSTLSAGINTYTAGASKLYSGSTDLYNGVKKASKGVSTIQSSVDESIDKLNTTASDTVLGTLEAGSKSVSSSTQSAVKIIENAQTLIKAYNATGDSKYLTQLNSVLNMITSDQLTALNQGSQQVNAGTLQLIAGMKEVKTNTKDLKDGLALLQSSFGDERTENTLINGAYAINAGLKQLTDNNAVLKGGAAQLELGLQTLAANNATLNGGVSQLSAGLDTLKANNSTLTGGASQLSAGLDTLKANNSTLTGGASQVAGGAKQLADGTSTLNANVPTLSNGVTKLDSGASQLLTGSKALYSGAKQVADGSVSLYNGVLSLKAGTSKLNSGANTLKDGIDTAKDGVDDSVKDTNKQLKALDGLADYAEEPASVKTEFVQPVENYGSAFAPYFMGLSLWVGGLMIFFGIYLDYTKKIKSLTKDGKSFRKKCLAFGGISAAQGVALAFIIKFALGIVVNNFAMLIGSCVLVSLCFMLIIQFFIMYTGNVGKFISLLLLILQLTSCAGTFPLETQNGFFQFINKFLPMTYSTQLFKEAISGTAGSWAAKNAAVIAAFTVGFLVLGGIARFIEKSKEKKNISLQPQEA
ncbi:MAG: YhgE/Pip domain-containing protein [Eubacterium sp.]|nr:YhgE/Pip domain-containing protein [Eubacterium sp.]